MAVIQDSTGANIAAVKPASTTVVATDAAIAVGIHPSSPLPTGTNTLGSVAINAGAVALGARPDAFLRIVSDPSTLLFDTFETVDTTNTWTIGGSVPPTGASGVLTCAAGTVASASSYASSKPTFIPGASAYLQMADVITLEAAVVTGNKRIWGLGVIAGAPTATIPVSNGCVFEVDTTGALFGVTYSGSVRTQTVALTRPTDGLVHRYALYYKASRAYFEIDNIQVGSLAFPNPQVAALSCVIGSFNDTASIAASATLTATVVGVADTAKNANQLSDGTYAWRKATIKPASTAALLTDTALVVSISPNSPSPLRAADLIQSVLGAANATATLTLPAAAAGLFHYITSIRITAINPTVLAIAASATLLTYTTTNLAGGVAWSTGNALGAGLDRVVTDDRFDSPIKSSVAATATTIVAPAIGVGGQVRITVVYYTAP